jgi:hypothetical protein
MNIHLPAILMWTEGVQGFDTLPYWNILGILKNLTEKHRTPSALWRHRRVSRSVTASQSLVARSIMAHSTARHKSLQPCLLTDY